jgi:Putative transposase/Transposase zinc-binding domain
MSRPTLEVADIIQAQGARYVDSHRDQISYQQLKVLNAIARCRTAALGGHIDDCPRCGHKAISYNSCRDRHCPKCQAQARQRWLAAREKELLGVPYFHLVFTLPHELIPLCQRNPQVLYNLLFRASAATMLEIAADPKHLGAEIGFLSILHTWGQNLLAHPHVHCVIPAGGFSADHTRWVHPKYPFFLPVKVLSRVFRGKFVDGLKRAYRKKKIRFSRANSALEEPQHFLRFLRTLFREDWVVYAKPAFGGGPQVLRYLGRYTHRVAISNHRLLAFDGERVTFRWKDYAHGNKQRKMTLTATEFLRRFIQHVLPRGFVRIRHFGFLANSCRTARLNLSRRLLAVTPKPREPCAQSDSRAPTWCCPRCGAAMRIGPNLTAVQLAFRCSFFDSS